MKVCAKIEGRCREYQIIIEEGIVTRAGLPPGFIITDSEVYRLYRHLIPDDKNKYRLIKGENSKTYKNAGKIADKIESLNYSGPIIAWGGGMVGDIAGFTASICNRGFPLIMIPTTLLAMVDAAIGGKNGVNAGKRKNARGTFYQPALILTDLLFLATLPKREFSSGWAEIIKYWEISGTPSFETLSQGIKKSGRGLEKIIAQCCRIKTAIVREDERDENLRHVLNFGHTIGHALELSCGLSHGEAVAIGMPREAEIGEKLGLVKKGTAEKIRELLTLYGLPVDLPQNYNFQEVMNLLEADKKGKYILSFNLEHPCVKVPRKLIAEKLK